ncbi:MAG: inositol monophosphatase family protein [Candidatus Bathyarchaeia archaeon]
MKNVYIKKEIKCLCEIAKKAGKALLPIFRDNVQYSFKAGRANVVTEADILVEDMIRSKLRRLFPGVPVVGEELSDDAGTRDDIYFLIDPLDGTLNFLHGIPLFAVSIALVEKSYPKIGVVYAPALDETFCAADKCGSFLNNKLLRIRKSLPIEQALAATGWPYDPQLLEWAKRALLIVQPKVQEVRILGAASLEMCYVAAEFLDIYWEIGLAPWDIAAGWLVLKEAGGCVLDVNGADFNPISGRILAGVSEALCREIASIFIDAGLGV